MLLKLLVIALVFLIIYCLGSAMVFMLRRDQPERMARALTWRIALSVGVFIFLFIAFFMGWISPHGIVPPQ